LLDGCTDSGGDVLSAAPDAGTDCQAAIPNALRCGGLAEAERELQILSKEPGYAQVTAECGKSTVR
jgi:hypothetical protein